MARLAITIDCNHHMRWKSKGEPQWFALSPILLLLLSQTFTGRLVDLTSDEKTTMETSPGRLVSRSGGGGPREDNAALPTACLHLTEAEFAF